MTATQLHPNQVGLETPSLAYEKVKRLIFDHCHGFVRHFHGNYDDYLSESHLLFMDAYNTYNPEKAKFTTHVRWRVYYGLMDMIRKQFKESERLLERSKSFNEAENHKNGFRGFIGELSADAATVARLLLQETPIEAMKNENKLDAGKASVVRLLIDDLGWDIRQITRCFTEIRDALS